MDNSESFIAQFNSEKNIENQEPKKLVRIKILDNKLLEIIINIIFFEKLLLTDEKLRLNAEHKFYLIDYNFIKQIKACIDYQKLKNSLLEKYHDITYSKLKDNLEKIISEVKDKCKVKMLNEIDEPSPKKIKYKDMIYFPKVYIISSTIYDIMKKFPEFNQYKEQKNSIITFRKEDIIINEDFCLNVGYLNDDFAFIANYLFSFKFDYKIKEIDEIKTLSIDEYIISRNCVNNNYEIQILKKQNSEIENQ